MTVTDAEPTFRQLAKVVEIDGVFPIEGADKIERVQVGGWNVVSQKGLYQVGDEALFMEIDSMLPIANPAFAFLSNRGVREYNGVAYHRLKTVKLRGVISQGLLVPLSEFNAPVDETDVDWTAYLGIKKFDDFMSATSRGRQVGTFPRHLGQKTDAERVQNLTKHWQDIRELGPWFATEKIDGTSLSVFRKDGELVVCSRNYIIAEDQDSLYWKAVRDHQLLFDQLREGWGIQAEVFGPGIQNNPLAIDSVRIGIFNVLDHGEYVPRALWASDFQRHGVPTYDDFVLPKTVAEAVEQVDGLKSKINPDRQAEGVVWTHPDGTKLVWLGDRPCFKAINNKLLLKDKS